MATSTETGERLRFGSFELDVRSRELWNGGTRIRLQEQPFEILRMMLERPGHVVTRDELQKRLWPEGTFVDFDHSLNAAVKRLRAVLGDDAENPRFVETVPRRGYRFIARSDADESVRDVAVGLTTPRLRLAVLPFTDLSQEDGKGYFADGLTEETISQLGRLCRGRLGIIARTSSMMFRDADQRAREIGQALRVDYLLEGSVRREGDRARITARLVETPSETNLWVETYESQLTDCLSVQKDLAVRIAGSLATELMPEEPGALPPTSNNATAYQAYLKGRYYWNMLADTGADQAVLHFERATELDPSFALAHASMARSRILQAEYYDVHPRRALEAARQSAKRALELDSTLCEAHLALGDVRRMLEWDWRGAETAYARAIVLNPSHGGPHRAYGLLLAALQRPAEAIRECDRACDMDPLCVVVTSSGAAWVRYLVGDYESAIARSREAVRMEPGYFAAHRILAAAYLQSGRTQAAIDVLEGAREAASDDPTTLAWLAHANAAIGRRDAALDLLSALSRTGRTRWMSSYHLALAHVGLGDVDSAFAALERATVDGDPALVYLATEPRFEPIRSDGRYGRLIALLGL